MITRRKLLIEATPSLLFAPAIVRFGSLMPVRNVVLATERLYFGFAQRQYVRGYMPTITKLQNTGLSVHEIAAELNKRGWKAMNSEACDSQNVMVRDWA